MDSGTLPRRPLGQTGLMVSRLGLAGSYGIDAGAAERAFHELGINYFFVTPRMKGLAEGVRRLVRAGYRDKMVIASGSNFPVGAYLPIRWARTVKALGIGHIDVFHLFFVNMRWFVGGRTWPAMIRLKKEGKVRALAISSHNRPLAAALAKDLGLDVLMVRYNAAHRGAEQEIFEPLRKLQGTDRPGIVTYTATRWRQLLKPIDGLGPMTVPECYRFALSHPAVDVVLSGAGTYEQLSEDAGGALAGPLDPSRMEAVRRFGDAVHTHPRVPFSFRGRRT